MKQLLAQHLGSPRVVWYELGDDILVEVQCLHVELHRDVLSVTLPLETTCGRAPLEIAFAFGPGDDGAGLIAVTPELPRGDARVAARWGRIAQDAIWACLLAEAAEVAHSLAAVPHAFSTDGERFGIHVGNAFVPATLRRCC